MELLQKLVEQGFTLRSLEAYPRHLGAEKYNCVALLEPSPEGGWRQYSSAGYLIDGQIALLVEREGQPTFVYKSKQLLAEGAVLADFQRFLQELAGVLARQ